MPHDHSEGTPLPRFKSRQLALVVAVADTGSVRQAAEQIHLSQPAATRLLHELEAAMGVTLFERSRQGMVVTAAGQVMVEHARALLAGMKDAYVSTKEMAAGKVGSVRVGIFGSADPERVATALLLLKQQFPRIKAVIKEAPLEMLLTALREGELDLVIGHMRAAADFGETFEHEVLYQESFTLVSGAAHGPARQEAVSTDELMQKMWVVPPSDTLLRQHVDAFFERAFGTSPAFLIETSSLLGSLALLCQPGTVGVMATQMASMLSTKGMLSVLPMNIGNFVRPIVIVTVRGATLKPYLKRLIELLQCQSSKRV